MRYAPNDRRALTHQKRRPALKKISTMQAFGNEIFTGAKADDRCRNLPADRWSFYCVLDEAGKIILEQNVPTTPEAMKQTLWKDTAKSQSPWRPEHIRHGQAALLTELEHEVIVAHAQTGAM